MVEVPLSEIFKRVKPELLKRRADQRQSELAEEGIDVFGDKENPYTIAPTSAETQRRPGFAPTPQPREHETDFSGEPSPEPVLKTQTPILPTSQPASAPSFRAGSGVMRLSTPSSADTSAAPLARPSGFSPSLDLNGGTSSSGLRMAPPGNGSQDAAPKPARPSINRLDERTTSANLADAPPLVIPLKDVIAKWPESIVSELGSIDGATVTLPAAEVGSGLAKGKVAFTWGQLRSWIQPPRESDTTNPTDLELALPLRVLAPAFLHSSKQLKEQRRTLSIDESIPALFAGGPSAKAAPAPVAPPPLPATEPEPEATVAEPPQVEEIQTPTDRAELEAPATAENAPAEPLEAPKEFISPVASISQPARESEEVAAAPPAPPQADERASTEPSPTASETTTPILADDKVPHSLSEVFGQPGKASWSPGEIVQEVVKLPQIAGAIIALSEGLVVSHRLPEGMKGEVVAAFLPQIFGRLNQYSTEMKLGEIEEILLSAQGAYFQAFHSGQVFFAVLGKPGESLPWHALRLMAAELLHQTNN
jgi:predicted regulator of Ras-like GTPase activity (Roadblock/LC7/MglB family)